MESSFELEDRLNSLHLELHEIMRLTKHHKIDNKDAELKNFRKLIKKVGFHRVDEEDTTLMIREMREKQYDV
ncbi:MAG: hypothetical protein U9P81_08905 [Euryarchaeota archaeon]|nr:hypothetical protein [Euryarchaeota archaeon]